MKVACLHKGGGYSLWPENRDKTDKLLCIPNKKAITEIKFSNTNFLKMIISWAIFAAFIWKSAAVSASFGFCLSEK